MSIVNRVYPSVLPPVIGTPALVEALSPEFTSSSDQVTFDYSLTASVTTFVPPPLRSWRAFVQGSSDLVNWVTASSFTNLGVGTTSVNLVINPVNRVVNNYYRIAVTLTDTFGNAGIVYPSSSVQLLKNKIARHRYYNTQTSFSPIAGASTFDLLFTSKGGDGYGEIPGGYVSGGGGAGVKITGIPVNLSHVFFVETRNSVTECFIRRDSAVSTANQVRAVNGTDAISLVVPGTDAPAATVSGMFSDATVVANNGGNAPTVIALNEYASTSGIFFIDNPLYPGFPRGGPSGQLDGAAGLVDNPDGFPFFIPSAIAFGCAGFGVTFPEGVDVNGQGMSGVVEVTYCE
jgi:hypothetical protein